LRDKNKVSLFPNSETQKNLNLKPKWLLHFFEINKLEKWEILELMIDELHIDEREREGRLRKMRSGEAKEDHNLQISICQNPTEFFFIFSFSLSLWLTYVS